MIELARAQDEEVGDGTTSVIITAGEILTAVEGFLEREIHPTVIVNAYFKALEKIIEITESLGVSKDAKSSKIYGLPKEDHIYISDCIYKFCLHYCNFKC